MADHNELKRLTTKKGELKEELRILKAEKCSAISEYDRKISKWTKDLQSVERRIEALVEESKSVVISEHAILQYLIRVKGVDVEAIKKEMLPDKIVEQVKTLGGDGAFPVDGYKLKMSQGVVTTVTTVTTNGEHD